MGHRKKKSSDNKNDVIGNATLRVLQPVKNALKLEFFNEKNVLSSVKFSLQSA